MKPISDDLWAVIMAGGSGTRFWPVSRQRQPKQLSRLLGEQTMIQATVARLQPLIPPDRVLVITREDLVADTREQLPMLPADHIIGEPVGRDTAPCVALAARIVQRIDPDGVMAVLPADQVIQPATALHACLQRGARLAREGGLVTYGVRPRFAATGYGYIKLGASLPADPSGIPAHAVQAFVEKPDEAVAQSYVADGSYLWNSGMFTWTAAAVLDELRAHTPDLVAALDAPMAAWGTPAFRERIQSVYPNLKKVSVDYALMEKSQHVKVVTAELTWDDVGSWDAICDHLPADSDGVIRRGDTIAIDCRDSLLFAGGKAIVTGVGLKGVMVIATDDGILVCERGRSQLVKRVVQQLEEEVRDELL